MQKKGHMRTPLLMRLLEFLDEARKQAKSWLSAKNILHGRYQRAHGRQKGLVIDGFDAVPDKNL